MDCGVECMLHVEASSWQTTCCSFYRQPHIVCSSVALAVVLSEVFSGEVYMLQLENFPQEHRCLYFMYGSVFSGCA